MSTIVTRAGKGSPLENSELDSNFTNLNTDKLEINAALGTPASVTLTNATGLPTAGLVDNAVTDAKLRDSAGLSVIGRGANSTGDPADIVAGTNKQVLRREGSDLAFGAVDLSSNQAVTGTLPVNQGGTGITSFGSGIATWLGTPSSANLAAAVTDETGTGALVFANSPTLVTPALGTPASGVVTNLTGTASININGTVGATTPAAGAFTTLNTSGAVVFNEAGANVDFRVEGDTNANLLFVDASADNVGIGTSSPASLLEVQGGLTTTGAVVTLSSKETSTVANDVLGRVNFRAALDAAGGDAILTGASIVALAEGTFSSTSNATSLLFQTGSSEAATTKMTLTSAGNVGIGTSSPTGKLEVAGVAVAGSAASGTTGSLVLRSRETIDFTRLSIGALHSSGAIYIGRAVEPSTTVADGFNGGITGTTGGGAWVIGGDGSTRFESFPSGAMTKGSAVSMLERMRINSAGNVGIGTTSPDANLTVNGAASFAAGTALLPSIARSGDLNTGIWFPAADTIAFSEGGVERMRIDSSGNLLVGTTVAASTQGAVLQVNTATAIRRNIASSGGTALRMEKSRSATDGGYTIVQSGDSLGELQFYGSDGVDFALAAEISAEVDGTPGSNDMPGRLVFSTSAGGSATPTERMRIDSAGNVGIGTTSPQSGFRTDIAGRLRVRASGYSTSNAFGDFVIVGSTTSTDSTVFPSLKVLNRSATTESLSQIQLTAGDGGVIGDIIADGVGTANGLGSAGVGLRTTTNHPLMFRTNNTERLRITNAGNVGIGTSSPSASAILDAQSTTKGVRMPNMTTTEKNAISSPAAGLMVYDTTLAKLCVYTTAWETITSL